MFDRKLYHETVQELRAPQNKIEEIIAMTQQKTKKNHRRPIRTLAVAAAAVAMLSIGVSAANLDSVQEFFLTISTVVTVDPFRTDIVTEQGDQISVLDTSQISVEAREDRVFLVAGEEEMDITQALEEEGRYEYHTTAEGTDVTAVVTGTPEQYTLDVTMAAEVEDGVVYSYSMDSEGAVNDLEGPDGMTISVYESEDGLEVQELS